MRPSLLAGVLLLAAVIPRAATAQTYSGPNGDVAATFQWARANTPAGQCGCFGLLGGGISASWYVTPEFAFVADASSQHATSVNATNRSLTLTSGLVGARLILPTQSAHGLRPFAQVLAGPAHAGGGVAASGDHSYAFAARVGGGVDLPIKPSFAIRLVQFDYYFTEFDNATVYNHQSNLLLSGGLIYHWSK